jgi:hypothetical protein
LRRRVAEHESELAALRLQIATASTASVVINGLATAPYADGDVPDDVPEPVPDVVDQARYLAAELLTRYVQEEALDVLDGARLHLYLFDDDTGLLTPVLEPEADHPVVAGLGTGSGRRRPRVVRGGRRDRPRARGARRRRVGESAPAVAVRRARRRHRGAGAQRGWCAGRRGQRVQPRPRLPARLGRRGDDAARCGRGARSRAGRPARVGHRRPAAA